VARWISVLADGRASCLDVFLSLVRVCGLFRKAWRRRLPKDGIRFFPSIPRPGGAISIIGGRVKVCLQQIPLDLVGVCLRWILLDPVFVRVCWCVFRLDPSDLLFSSSVTVAVLVHWFYGAFARRSPDCLLQQGLPGSREGGAMTAAHLRLAPVLVVVARWSIDLDVISFISGVLCTTLIVDE
jgi:hypothetical protein